MRFSNHTIVRLCQKAGALAKLRTRTEVELHQVAEGIYHMEVQLVVYLTAVMYVRDAEVFNHARLSPLD